MNLVPALDIMIVKELKKGMQKKGELFITETTVYPYYEAEVVAVGPGAYTSGGVLIPPLVQPGQIVLLTRATSAMPIEEDGETYLMVHASAVLATRKSEDK